MFIGLTYGGKAADTWAVGVTLYCMILGEYPFLGDTLQDTYDKVRHTDICDKARKTQVFIIITTKMSLFASSNLYFTKLHNFFT